jgi:hypothetical protein
MINNKLHRVVFEVLKVAKLFDKLSAFYGTQCSSPRSQGLVIEPEPGESSPHIHILFSEDQSYYRLFSYAWVSQMSSFLWGLLLQFYM